MKLLVSRVIDRDTCTLGVMKVDGHAFATLEDPQQDEKIAGNTRIPSGTYDIGLRKNSPLATKYRERYGDNHYGMIWLLDVPGFKYVYIHTGNTHEHTEGCLLVGLDMNIGVGTISQSRTAYRQLYPLVMAALEIGESVTIEIKDY